MNSYFWIQSFDEGLEVWIFGNAERNCTTANKIRVPQVLVLLLLFADRSTLLPLPGWFWYLMQLLEQSIRR